MPKLIPAERKALARKLRSQGMSINQIAEQVGIAKSSVSLIVRDTPLTVAQRAQLKANSDMGSRQRIGHLRRSELARNYRRNAQLAGRALAQLEDGDYAAGVMLYWAEGAKSRNHAHIANSDVELLKLWLGWFDRWYDLPRAKTTLVVNCFTNNGLPLGRIEDWWLRELGLPRSSLRKSVVNRPSSASKGVRRKLLYGTAHVTVRSTFLVQSIYGAIQEIGGFDRPEWLDLQGALPPPN